jgi:hypothetical protein
MSMRAAIHPNAKNNAGIGSSHQSSKSITRRPIPVRFHHTGRRRRQTPLLAPQAAELSLQARVAQDPRQQPGAHAERESDQKQEDQRRLP